MVLEVVLVRALEHVMVKLVVFVVVRALEL